MAYSKQTWVRGEKVASVKLNHMEDGIATISANGAIDTANLADGAVTLPKLADAVKSHFATADDVSELKSALDNINDLEYPETRVHANDLTYGRIYTTGVDTSVQYMAYSPTIRPIGESWYFDATKYKLQFAYYQNSDDANASALSNWMTSSPAKAENGRPYYKLAISTASGSGVLNISSAQSETYKIEQEDSSLIGASLLAKSRLTTVYVSAANGSDNNIGDADHPFATIGKGVVSGAENILVQAGTYGTLAITNIKYPIRIGIWGSTSGKIKITNNHSTTAYGVAISGCTDVTLSDIWVDDVQRHCFWCDGGKVTFIRCIASNNTTTAFMGFAFEGNTNAFLYDCISHDVAHDGFNFHGSGNSLVQNCKAYNCADDGISHHDSCTGYIVGGEYYNCGKGGVASPTYGASVDMNGVYSHDNNYGLYTMQDSGSPNCKSNICNCAFKNNTSYDLFIYGATVTGWNNIYDTKLVGTGATFTELT